MCKDSVSSNAKNKIDVPARKGSSTQYIGPQSGFEGTKSKDVFYTPREDLHLKIIETKKLTIQNE